MCIRDRIGPITKDVKDAAILLNVIAGHDEKDSTSENINSKDYTPVSYTHLVKPTLR